MYNAIDWLIVCLFGWLVDWEQSESSTLSMLSNIHVCAVLDRLFLIFTLCLSFHQNVDRRRCVKLFLRMFFSEIQQLHIRSCNQSSRGVWMHRPILFLYPFDIHHFSCRFWLNCYATIHKYNNLQRKIMLWLVYTWGYSKFVYKLICALLPGHLRNRIFISVLTISMQVNRIP